VLRDKPGKAWPTLEVDDVVFALLLGQPPGRSFTGEGHSHVQTSQQEPHLLPPRVLTKREREMERKGNILTRLLYC